MFTHQNKMVDELLSIDPHLVKLLHKNIELLLRSDHHKQMDDIREMRPSPNPNLYILPTYICDYLIPIKQWW